MQTAKWKSDLRFRAAPVTCMLVIASTATLLLWRGRNAMRPVAKPTPVPESRLQRIINSLRRSPPECRTTRDSITVSLKEYYRAASSLVVQALAGKRVTVLSRNGAPSLVMGVGKDEPFRDEDEEAMADIRDAEKQLKARPAEAWLA